MNINLKPATSDMMPDLLTLMNAFNQFFDCPFDKEIGRKNMTTFINNPELGKIWGIYANNQLNGYVVLALGFSFEYQGRDAFIDELYLIENYRAKGIGSKVLEMVSIQAKQLNVNAIHLEVEQDNISGNKLYNRHGFKNNGRILMTKRIN